MGLAVPLIELPASFGSFWPWLLGDTACCLKLALQFHSFVLWAPRREAHVRRSPLLQHLPPSGSASSQEQSPENPVMGPAENSKIGFDHISMQPSRAHLGRHRLFI